MNLEQIRDFELRVFLIVLFTIFFASFLVVPCFPAIGAVAIMNAVAGNAVAGNVKSEQDVIDEAGACEKTSTEQEMIRTMDVTTYDTVSDRIGMYNSVQKIYCRGGVFKVNRYVRVYYTAGESPAGYWVCGTMLDNRRCDYKTNLDMWAWASSGNIRVNYIQIGNQKSGYGWIANAYIGRKSFNGNTKMFFKPINQWCIYSIAAWKVGD
jgi:hypothetical protein